MAMVVSISGEENPRRSSFRGERRPCMLKDYLRDDMNSCSSNGFRSFPRRQCCAAVKNIIEKEIIRNRSEPPKRVSRSQSVSSALQRASMAVINAVKLLPFKSPAVKVADGNQILPRSISKKVFKRSFWMMKKSSSGERKAVVKTDQKQCECDEIERWISSGLVGDDSDEKYQPSESSNDTTAKNSSTTTSSSNSEGKSDSWSDITFTSDYLTSSSENDAVDRREKTPAKDDEVLEEEVSGILGETAAKSAWHNEASKKEQLSPISILDFPESDEGSLSPFSLRMTQLKGTLACLNTALYCIPKLTVMYSITKIVEISSVLGTHERLMQKLGRFESLVALGLEPLSLGSLMSCTQVKVRSPKFSIHSCSTPSYIVTSESEEEEEHCQENKAVKKAKELLNIMKARMPAKASHKFDSNHLLLNFFQENAFNKEDDVLLKEAEDWLNGHYDKMILHSNKVKGRRHTYFREMEGGGRWPRDAEPEKKEVAADLEAAVLAHLMEELLQECCS